MFCKKCGTEIYSGAACCSSCQTPVKFNTWLIPAIVTTVCCCLPFGIVGIVYAAKASSMIESGDFAGAQAAAKNAKLWSLIGIGLGAVGSLFYLVIGILGAVA